MDTDTPAPTDTHTATAIQARGGTDPWADDHIDPASEPFTARNAPRMFEPFSHRRLPNLLDVANAYSG